MTAESDFTRADIDLQASPLPGKQAELVQVQSCFDARTHTMNLSMCPPASETPGRDDPYLDSIRAEVRGYDRLQEAAISAIPFAPKRVLELGIGTAETTRRLLAAHPDAAVTGLDSSPDMVFRARELIGDVRLARMEDPLPDGPWDLVISVLSVHLLDEPQERDLFRRVRDQSRSLVIADRFGDSAPRLAEWCDGEITWREDELAVIRATYS